MDDDASDLGGPPEPDALARAVRRSRIAKRLFDADEPVRVGRYQLLERVGAGGLGVVWGAWDPELERRVAIKVLKPVAALPRERIVLEGQALARLSHPNVVPIYDVGVHDDRVYLVMEWVRGETLRTYAVEPRAVRDLVEVYRAAGAGLAAAHEVGLVHRDFKPDNAIRGEDGRVRVLDFGLARGEPVAGDDGGEAGVTRGAGTPRYMAPEQAAGTALTPAADQYAFAVSLREALELRGGAGTRTPVPGWLERILARATRHEPAERFASMPELLRALARDPVTTWRRRLIAASVPAVLLAAFWLRGSGRASEEVVPCSGAEAAIASAWNPARADRLVAHVRGLGPYGAAEAPRLATELGGYARRWAGVHRGACLAHERRETTPPVYARTLACLARARAGFDTIVEVLSAVPAPRLSKAIEAARGLPAVERCPLDSALSPVVPPPPAIAGRAEALASEIERARVLARTDHADAIAATRAAVAQADALGYAPLIARANLAHGLALLERPEAAVPVLHRAGLAALDAFDDVTFVEAYAREVYARSSSEAGTPAAIDAELAERIARRAGKPGAFARALLFNNLGTARLAAHDPAGARAWFDRALAEPGVVDRDAELLAVYGNRALVTDEPATRARLFEHARSALARLLGEHHRKTLDVRFQAAVFLADPRHAASELGALCALYERYHAALAESTLSDCVFELGWLAEERGDLATARAAMRQVRGDDGPVRAAAGAYLLLLDGKLEAAAAAARAIARRFEARTWTRFDAADAYRLAAECNLRLGRRAEAQADARAAVALFEQLDAMARLPNYQRRLARARAVLARLAPAREAERHARAAAAWYRTAGGYDDQVRELDAIATGSR